MKVALDEHVPIALVKVFQTFASERRFRKLTGSFEIYSAKEFTPAPGDPDYVAGSDSPWIKRFYKAGGRVIISGNTEMRSVPHERLALIECGMLVIFFETKWNSWGFFDKCGHFLHWWPKIAGKVRTGKKGTFWAVPSNWNAQKPGKPSQLRKLSNRDPRELKLERRAKSKNDKPVSRRLKAPPKVEADETYREDDLFTYASRLNRGQKG
ncbi:MAG: hypothetical protein ABR878_00960 [Roseiarcus sp.]